MGKPRRFRLTLFVAMIVVALCALFFAEVARERRLRLEAERQRLAAETARLRAMIERTEARVSWSEEMSHLGYVSKARVRVEKAALGALQEEFKELTSPKPPAEKPAR